MKVSTLGPFTPAIFAAISIAICFFDGCERIDLSTLSHQAKVEYRPKNAAKIAHLNGSYSICHVSNRPCLRAIASFRDMSFVRQNCLIYN